MKTFSNNFIYIKFEWNRSCPHNLPFFSFTFLSPSTNSKILTTHYSLNNYSLSSLFISLLTPSLSKFSHLIPFPILTIPSLLQPSHLFPIFPSLSSLPYFPIPLIPSLFLPSLPPQDPLIPSLFSPSLPSQGHQSAFPSPCRRLSSPWCPSRWQRCGRRWWSFRTCWAPLPSVCWWSGLNTPRSLMPYSSPSIMRCVGWGGAGRSVKEGKESLREENGTKSIKKWQEEKKRKKVEGDTKEI